MAGRFLVALAFCPFALAFSNTVPLVAWSSHSSGALDHLPSNAGHVAALVEKILLNEHVCDYDAVVVVEHPGLHASDLRTLSPSSRVARSLSSSPSSRQFQYVPIDPSFDLASIIQTVSARCGSRKVEYSLGQQGYFSEGSKHIFSLSLPSLASSGSERKEEMAIHESYISDELNFLASAFPNHLVMYTGSPPSGAQQHQSRQLPPPAPVRPALVNIQAPTNTTLPEGGILKRYQLLTPGLITVLLVTVFILLPVLFLGFSALASIQSPLRVEAPKGYSAAERKTQ